MTQIAALKCRCGKVRGHVENAAPGTANRMICHCDDCQAFVHYLERQDLLDEHAGSDIVQVAPATLKFEQGAEHIVGMRLSPKGLYRWYASCCNTPLGNTMSPSIPFVGIAASTFEQADQAFGPPTGTFLGKFAVGTLPSEKLKPQVGAILGALAKVFRWRIGGKVWPHPFFDEKTREPSRPVHLISKDERTALRAFCGPRPSAKAS
jgi:hypothetical protein